MGHFSYEATIMNNYDAPGEPAQASGKWLNRNVLGFGLTSVLSGFGHDNATRDYY